MAPTGSGHPNEGIDPRHETHERKFWPLRSARLVRWRQESSAASPRVGLPRALSRSVAAGSRAARLRWPSLPLAGSARPGGRSAPLQPARRVVNLKQRAPGGLEAPSGRRWVRSLGGRLTRSACPLVSARPRRGRRVPPPPEGCRAYVSSHRNTSCRALGRSGDALEFLWETTRLRSSGRRPWRLACRARFAALVTQLLKISERPFRRAGLAAPRERVPDCHRQTGYEQRAIRRVPGGASIRT